MATFRSAHKREINTITWHPIHETFFSSGSGDGVIAFWQFTNTKDTHGDEALGILEGAHDGIIWSLDWHPLGHLLASGSADFSTRFWTRTRPADNPIDRYVIGKAAADELGIKEQTLTMAEEEEDSEMGGINLPGLRGFK